MKTNNEILKMEYHIPEKLVDLSSGYRGKVDKCYSELKSGDIELTGWIDYPKIVKNDELSEIKDIASDIRDKCSVLVIVAIGGSYLGSKAAIEFTSAKTANKNSPEIIFAGINFSAIYHKKIIEKLCNKDICLCIISKSGNTAETNMAAKVFTEYMHERYEDKASDRIYVVTSPNQSKLHDLAVKNNYYFFDIPENIGGRYSVLTNVGLLPMAIAGLNINEVIEGAKSAMDDELISLAKQFACIRCAAQDYGKSVEIIGSFEPALDQFIEWLLQLYAESEGKNGQGMLPVNLEYTKDLHSLGQFLQEGTQIFTEMLINFKLDQHNDLKASEVGNPIYGDKSYNEFNKAAIKGLIKAHESVDIPVAYCEIPCCTEYYFGQTVYFFETMCALSGMLMNIDPFNQPGVEEYKREMINELKA